MENELHDALFCGNSRKAEQLAQRELNDGADPTRLVYDVIVPALEKVAKCFECQEFFVPELLISIRAAKCVLDVLEPALKKSGQEIKGCVVTGAVFGELHDIGIYIISLMLGSLGFKVVELGVDVRAEKFVDAVRTNKAELIMMSASNFPQKPYLQQTIEALKEAGLRVKVKVMVGGVSITQQYAEEIGADAYAQNAVEAVRLARLLVPTA